jgi:hypothetical protein
MLVRICPELTSRALILTKFRIWSFIKLNILCIFGGFLRIKVVKKA